MFSLLRILIVLIGAYVSSAMAHEIRPAVADIQFFPGGEVHLSMEVNLEVLIAGIDPRYSDTDDAPEAAKYNVLRSLSPAQLELEYTQFAPRYVQGITLLADGVTLALERSGVEIPVTDDIRLSRISTLHYRGLLPEIAQTIQFGYAVEYGNVAAKFRKGEAQANTVHWLTQGALSPSFTLDQDSLPRSRLETAGTYTLLGFVHIVPKGVDHILFVLGLFLLSLKLGPLLTQITTFTVAHSITLGLSIYGIISLSPLWVEPLIALSIFYVGIENIIRGRNSFSRLVVIFLFGLLHGLGFSTVLTEIGLPDSEFLVALLTFNVGVELGQLSVILVALGLVYLSGLARHPRYRQRVVIPGSALISMVGLYWFIERVALLPG